MQEDVKRLINKQGGQVSWVGMWFGQQLGGQDRCRAAGTVKQDLF